jgi:hypothetical protein
MEQEVAEARLKLANRFGNTQIGGKGMPPALIYCLQVPREERRSMLIR